MTYSDPYPQVTEQSLMHFGTCTLVHASKHPMSGDSQEDSRGWVLFMGVFLEGSGRTYMWIEAVMVAGLGPENISCLILFTGAFSLPKLQNVLWKGPKQHWSLKKWE